MKLEAAWPSEMVVSSHIIAWHHSPVDHNLNLHCLENLLSFIEKKFYLINPGHTNFDKT
jgi:hypothetical protein